jgi:hypothetical protein
MEAVFGLKKWKQFNGRESGSGLRTVEADGTFDRRSGVEVQERRAR